MSSAGPSASHEAVVLQQLQNLGKKAETGAADLFRRKAGTNVVMVQSPVPVWRGWWQFFFRPRDDVLELTGWYLGTVSVGQYSRQIVLLETGLLDTGVLMSGNRLRSKGPFLPESLDQIWEVDAMLDLLLSR